MRAMTNSTLWSLAVLLLLVAPGVIGYAVWILYQAFGRKPG
jgi:hypothetical protein